MVNALGKGKIDWRKLKHYQKSIVAKIEGKKIVPACIFCEAENNINVRAFWVDDGRKKVIMYHLCKACGDEFFSLPEAQRESLVTKVIEKRINALLDLPHLKTSQLLKAGFEIGF